jgi:hypothetical protein
MATNRGQSSQQSPLDRAAPADLPWRQPESSAPFRRRTAHCIAVIVGAAILLGPIAQTNGLEILGQVGVLGEWELTAKLDEIASDAKKEYSGPLLMRHVGICTQDGPEERAGQMRLQLGTSDAQLKATLTVEGVECHYDGRKLHAYEGTMTCLGREDLPMMLWLN